MYGYIYKIENLLNSKIYIGQSINPERRKLEHFTDLKNDQHKNPHLQNAFQLYGKNIFKFSIIGWANSKEELDKLEIYFIKKYDSLNKIKGYNIREGGSNGRLSPETRKKLSESHKGKFSGEKHPMYGKNHSEKTKNKMRRIHKGKKISLETKIKMSTTWHGFNGCYYANKNRNPWTRVWRSQIRYNGKNKSLGFYEDPLSASLVSSIVLIEID